MQRLGKTRFETEGAPEVLDRRRAIAALTAAGLLWGTTVPLSKLALGWLAPGWLTVARFGLAAAILVTAARRATKPSWVPPASVAWIGLLTGKSTDVVVPAT